MDYVNRIELKPLKLLAIVFEHNLIPIYVKSPVGDCSFSYVCSVQSLLNSVLAFQMLVLAAFSLYTETDKLPRLSLC